MKKCFIIEFPNCPYVVIGVFVGHVTTDAEVSNRRSSLQHAVCTISDLVTIECDLRPGRLVKNCHMSSLSIPYVFFGLLFNSLFHILLSASF